VKIIKVDVDVLNNLFDKFDADKSGWLEKIDFELLIEDLAISLELDKTNVEFKNFKKEYLDMWEQVKNKADLNKDGKISREEFIIHNQKIFEENLKASKETMNNINEFIDD